MEQGQIEEGMAQMREGNADWEAMGGRLFRPIWLASLAVGYGRLGQFQDGLISLGQALRLMEETGERWLEAELYRLKGELTLQSQTRLAQVNTGHDTSKDSDSRRPPSDLQSEAESYFHKAIAVAQKQQAKSLELRASVSLVRLWQQQGKQREAHSMLSDIYNWFTEGFETKDLQEARALLEELHR
jgi:predicted ATPase